MTMQPRPRNPIEQRKQDVRKYTRNAAICAGGGVVGGALLSIIAGSFLWLILGLVIAVAGGGYYWSKVQKIVNHKDNY